MRGAAATFLLRAPGLLLVLCMAGCDADQPAEWPGDEAPALVEIAELSGHAEAWRRSITNQHADPSTSIHSQNIERLQLAWKIDTGGRNVSHMPLVDGGRLYFADWGGHVYAADAKTGKILWNRQMEKPREDRPWHGFCGTGALGGGLLFEASAEGNAFAIDPRTGRVIWRKRFANDTEAGNRGAIRCHDGRLFIGVSSVEEGLAGQLDGFEVNFRGKVVALDAKTGRKLWERMLAPRPGNGVAVSGGFAIDPESDLLYFTTGGNCAGRATELSDAIIAIHAPTGEIRWSRQLTAQDAGTRQDPDHDFAAAPQLFEAKIDGRMRHLVGAGQKDGVFWVLDRRTGDVVWSTTAGHGQIGGGIHAEASIGEDGRIYLWGNNGYAYENPDQHPMDVRAVDAATGQNLWSNTRAQPAGLTSAGFLSSDLYFVGSLDGRVRAYRAPDGRLVWTSPETAPIASSLWVHDDMLYFGAGVPPQFGGREGSGGLWAFTPVPAGAPATQP